MPIIKKEVYQVTYNTDVYAAQTQKFKSIKKDRKKRNAKKKYQREILWQIENLNLPLKNSQGLQE